MPGSTSESRLEISIAAKAQQPSHAEDPDVELMLRYQQGEKEAFDELVRRNVGNVHALVYRFLREPSQVDDITQEVFLRIHRNAHRYEPTAKFSTWLYRIVANLCFNVMRSRKKGVPVSLDSPGGHDDEDYRRTVPDEAQPAPEEGLAEDELSRQIARAMDALPENQRIAIILNKYENKSYQEIADVLETSTMAVKSLLSRARSTLREKLRKYVETE
jgi:RNA polymerase sigma-70 factor, ECF subfamily